MAEETKIDDVTPEAGVMDVVKSISDNQRADAIDKLQDYFTQDQVMLLESINRP